MLALIADKSSITMLAWLAMLSLLAVPDKARRRQSAQNRAPVFRHHHHTPGTTWLLWLLLLLCVACPPKFYPVRTF